jgi:putative Mn2+ efflux pump MntP
MEVPIAYILERFFISAINYIPNIVSAIILLIIGLLLGKAIGWFVKECLVRLKIDDYLPLKKRKMISVSEIFSLIIKWWIYLAFIAAALSEQILGIKPISLWIESIVRFIPNIIGGALIIIVGYLLGELISNEIKKSETVYSSLASKIIFFFIMYVSIALALPILGISADLVNNILLIIIGSIGLGTAIAIGLGLKGPIEEIARDYMKKKKQKG